MNKKIGIITLFYKNYNYGGQLQALAMQKIFEDKGYDSYVVQFKPYQSLYYLNRVYDLGFIDTVKLGINKLKFKKLLRKKPDLKSLYQKRIKRFDEFLRDIPKTKLYSEKTLALEDPFDIYVCGSDQIWNPAWWNNILLLGFTNKPKFSYAASIAREQLTPKQVDCLRRKLRDYVGISTRENAAQIMLQQILHREIQCCLDPTLLIDTGFWESISESTNDNSGKYLLVYNLGNSTTLVDDICGEYEKKGYKTVFVGFGHNTFFMTEKQKVSVMIMDAGPRQWLGLIRGAECVITDSFHGTVFSVLFGKKFWCIEKDKDKKNNENTRLYSLLDSLSLQDRLLKKRDDFNIERSINYEFVKQRLEMLRMKSFDYIDKCLKLSSSDVGDDAK